MAIFRLGSWLFLAFAVLTMVGVFWQLIRAYLDGYLGWQIAATFPLLLIPALSFAGAAFLARLANGIAE